MTGAEKQPPSLDERRRRILEAVQSNPEFAQQAVDLLRSLGLIPAAMNVSSAAPTQAVVITDSDLNGGEASLQPIVIDSEPATSGGIRVIRDGEVIVERQIGEGKSGVVELVLLQSGGQMARKLPLRDKDGMAKPDSVNDLLREARVIRYCMEEGVSRIANLGGVSDGLFEVPAMYQLPILYKDFIQAAFNIKDFDTCPAAPSDGTRADTSSFETFARAFYARGILEMLADIHNGGVSIGDSRPDDFIPAEDYKVYCVDFGNGYSLSYGDKTETDLGELQKSDCENIFNNFLLYGFELSPMPGTENKHLPSFYTTRDEWIAEMRGKNLHPALLAVCENLASKDIDRIYWSGARLLDDLRPFLKALGVPSTFLLRSSEESDQRSIPAALPRLGSPPPPIASPVPPASAAVSAQRVVEAMPVVPQNVPIEIRPIRGDLIEGIKQTLAGLTLDHAPLGVTPSDLETFLSTMKLPVAVKLPLKKDLVTVEAEMVNPRIQIQGDKIIVQGKINGGLGSSEFNLTCIIREGKIVLINRRKGDIKTSGSHSFGSGEIEKRLENVNEILKGMIESEIENWKVGGFDIDQNKNQLVLNMTRSVE